MSRRLQQRLQVNSQCEIAGLNPVNGVGLGKIKRGAFPPKTHRISMSLANNSPSPDYLEDGKGLLAETSDFHNGNNPNSSNISTVIHRQQQLLVVVSIC